MACVRRRRGKWVVDYYDVSNQRHIFQVEGGREDADKKLSEIVREGKKAVNTKITFKEYADWWLKNCAKSEIKESTYEEYDAVLRNHVYPVFGSKLMNKISRKDMREFVSEKRAAKLSRSTIRNILAPVRAMYNQMIEDEESTFNPAANVGKLNKKRKHEVGNGTAKQTKKLDTLVKHEIATFLAKAEEKSWHYYPAFLCAFRSGLRMGELIALKPMDLDFNSRFVEVRRTFYRGRITAPKDNEPRRVDMSGQLTAVLTNLVSKRKAAALRKEMEKPARERRDSATVVSDMMEEWLFTTPVGTQLDPSNLRKVFWGILAAAKIRRIRFHDIRHTYATLLIEQGESLAYVRDQLGHSSIQITVDTYGHLVPGGNRQAVDRLDDPPVMTKREDTASAEK